MIPLGDDNSQRKTFPLITYFLIFINIIVFFLEISQGEQFILKWAFTPSAFIADPWGHIPSLFTSMFMHAGWAHLLGNMLYLGIFGDNVEDDMGKIQFLIFYLACGLLATFAQLAMSVNSTIPNLGASGAIAGVLGAYIYLFPQTKIKVILGSQLNQMPALLVIGFWFLLQFISNISGSASTGEEGGVAYMAHIGGFLAGLSIAFLLSCTQKVQP
jgi:membrane associated rhomboid family serine protease